MPHERAALGDIDADRLKRIGLNVDAQYADSGSTLRRVTKTEPVQQGGIAGLADKREIGMNGCSRRN